MKLGKGKLPPRPKASGAPAPLTTARCLRPLARAPGARRRSARAPPAQNRFTSPAGLWD